MALFEPLFEALNRGGVRYVVVGGVAVVLHGFARLTGDVDLIVDLDPHEARKAMDVLTGLGLKPRAPVDALAFADPVVREGWLREKGMRVFSMWDPKNAMREVDVFAEHPIPFCELWSRSQTIALETTTIRVAAIADLIALKRIAGRVQDLADIEALEAIAARKDPKHGGG